MTVSVDYNDFALVGQMSDQLVSWSDICQEWSANFLNIFLHDTASDNFWNIYIDES